MSILDKWLILASIYLTNESIQNKSMSDCRWICAVKLYGIVYSMSFFVKVEENSGIILAGLVSVSLTLRLNFAIAILAVRSGWSSPIQSISCWSYIRLYCLYWKKEILPKESHSIFPSLQEWTQLTNKRRSIILSYGYVTLNRSETLQKVGLAINKLLTTDISASICIGRACVCIGKC